MAPSTSTFATLRALHLVIADALDDIQRVFSQHTLPDPPSPPASQCSSPVYPSSPDPSGVSSFPTTPPTSFPPTPLSATFPSSPPHTDAGVPLVDYPSPDSPFVSASPGEQLALHPDAAAAASRIVAACGQMSSIVHKPFLSLCDAIMSYNLPACMRLIEHLHVAEILREAEENRHRCLASEQEAAVPLSDPNVELNIGASVSLSAAGVEWTPGSSDTGLHVADITNVICSYAGNNYVDPNNLVHALRLLSTHHIFRETEPDTFALTRVASLLDSGKSVKAVFSSPETKYDDAGGTPAFVALITDELFKSAAYLTEAFTGVRLPMPGPTPDPSFPPNGILSGTTKLPSAPDYATNDTTSCAPITRSSSALTHIVYPEDDGVQPPSRLLPSTESLENMKPNTLSTSASVPSRSLSIAASPFLPPRPSSVEDSTPMDGCQSSATLAKQQRLAAFNLAFRTTAPFFDWLENEGEDPLGGVGQGACRVESIMRDNVQPSVPGGVLNCVPRKSFRLDRFSKAMMGTTGWEAPRAILGGFDWYSLPKGSTIVDVGGGIGSTTMILARALNDPKVDFVKKQVGPHNEGLQPASPETPRDAPVLPNDPSLVDGNEARNTAAKNDVNLRFVVQDRPVVTALGVEAWRAKWPEMLESGQVIFQDQDFFEPQLPFESPHVTRHPAIYLLRVVLHDWPDELARRILINLRVASDPETRLVIAEHVLPLACVDEDIVDHVCAEAHEGISTEEWTLSSVLANIEGAERTLVPAPLLSNLGKASANAYWMDLLMHISLNGKERTLREFCALALSAGWRVTRMTRPEGSLFAYLVCEPITLPEDAQAIHNAVVLSSELATVVAIPSDEPMHQSHVGHSHQKPLPARPVSLLPSPILERSSSRCGTPTFGSRILLPTDEDLPSPRTRGGGAAKKWLKSKRLGVRSVMMQKVEKQREEQSLARSAPAQNNSNAQSGAPTSSSHTRVWWKKSHPNSASNSSIAVHEQNGDVSEHRSTRRGRRGTLKSSDSPSTPSPRASPAHQNWPSTESSALSTPDVSPPVSQTRRPSVASITRKLSFATFGRKPSIADITEPLPTPPPSATLTELAPPPPLQGDTKRSLKHLPSLPTLGRRDVRTSTTARPPAISRRSTLSFTDRPPPSQAVPKPALPRRPDITGSPKSSVIQSGTNACTSKQGPAETGRLPAAESTLAPRRQRRVTLSNSPGTSSRTYAQGLGGVNMSVPANPASREVKRIPSMPKLPRRLSIPRLRRKQSQSIIQDVENKSSQATGC